MRLSLFFSTILLGCLAAGCESHRNVAQQLGCAGDCALNKETVVLWCSSKANLYTREPAKRQTVFEGCLAENGYAKLGVLKPLSAQAAAKVKNRGRKKPAAGTRDFDPRDLFTDQAQPPSRAGFNSN